MDVDYSAVPEELKQLRQWVVHKNKVPHNPRTGRSASPTDPATWGTFQEACTMVQRGSFSGIGFMFAKDDPYTGVDFDHCLTGSDLDAWVSKQLNELDSYTEISPSGTGLHVICRAAIPAACKKNGVELYDVNRFFTVTGNAYCEPKPIRNAAAQVSALYAELKPQCEEKTTLSDFPAPEKEQSDADVLALVLSDPECARLYNGDYSDIPGKANGEPDYSVADFILCKHLAKVTGGNADQMDRLFRNSAIYRSKWDSRRGKESYGAMTIKRAIQWYHSELSAFDEPAQPATKPAGLQIFSASDLAEKHLDPIRYFVDDLLPQGLALLSSPPKFGKSWFVLDMCLAISTGADFLGMKTHKSGCLYLALEDSENRLKGRMMKVLAGNKAPKNFMFSISAPTLDDGLLDQLGACLDQYPDTGVIVIDTLQKIRGSAGRTEGAYKYDYRELGALKAFADSRKILLLLVHHLRKMKDDADPHNQISGTNGIMGAADTSLVLTRAKRSEENTTLSVTGRDVDMNEFVLQFDKFACRWNLIGSTDKVAAIAMQKKYHSNPLVMTLRYLLQHSSSGTWRGKISDIINASRGFDFEIKDKPRKVSNLLKDIEADLQYYDGITFSPWSKGSQGGGRTYEFRIDPDNDSYTGVCDV